MSDLIWDPRVRDWNWLAAMPLGERSKGLKHPPEFGDAELDAFKAGEIAAFDETHERFEELGPVDGLGRRPISDLVAGGPRDVFIQGRNGSGKTYLACAMGKHWGAMFLDTINLLSQIRSSFRHGGYNGLNEAGIIKRYVEFPALILDDITAASTSDFGSATVLNLLKQRGEQIRPTIVTSFSTIDGIAKHLDWSVASRLSAYTKLRLIYKGHPSGDRRRQRP